MLFRELLSYKHMNNVASSHMWKYREEVMNRTIVQTTTQKNTEKKDDTQSNV